MPLLFQDTFRGTTLEQFDICEAVGRGACGTVYHATYRSLGDSVAVKLLDISDPRALAQYHAERLFLANSNHRHIPVFIGAGIAGTKGYIITEFLPHSLEQCFSDRPFDWDVAVKITKGILEALAYAHTKGVLHGDVSPRNILFSNQGLVKLSDFGNAVKPVELEKSNPLRERVLGTVLYAAPEMLGLTSDAPSERSDIFSAGQVLYQLLTAQVPYGDCPVPSKHSSVFLEGMTVPADLDVVVRRATAYHAAGRYESARQMIQALDAACKKKPEPASRVLAPFLGVRLSIHSTKSEQGHPERGLQEYVRETCGVLAAYACTAAKYLVPIAVLTTCGAGIGTNLFKTIHS